MSKQVDNTGPRVVPRGSCTWCSHKPHTGACPSKIRTDTKAAESPCPCSRHLWKKETQ